MARSKSSVRFKVRLRSRPEDIAVSRTLEALPHGELQPFLRALALVGFHAIKNDKARARGGQSDGRAD